MRHRCAEFVFKSAAHQRVQAIGCDDQVVTPELIHRLDCRVVARLDADGADAGLQDGQEIEPADRREADAVDLDAFAAQMKRDVLPALHPRRDRIHGVGIVGAQEFERLLGEHHAEAPGGAGRILLEQIDLRLGVTLLPEIGEVETSGASADHGDTQALPPNWQYTVNWECRAFMIHRKEHANRFRCRGALTSSPRRSRPSCRPA